MRDTLLRTVRRLLTFAALGSVLAGTASAQAFRARVRMPAYQTAIALDTLAVRTELDAPPGQVFQVTAAAFEHEIKIDVTVRDSVSGLVGNPDLVKIRRLGRAPLSRYVNCGSGMTGPNADSYRVYLAVIAFVDSLGPKKTRLGVAVAASAQDLQGNSKAPVGCGSTGSLETQLQRVVAARFGIALR